MRKSLPSLHSPEARAPADAGDHQAPKRIRSMGALALKLAELKSKACEATRLAAKHRCAYHKTLMKRNKQYVVNPPTIEKCQDLSMQFFYILLAKRF